MGRWIIIGMLLLATGASTLEGAPVDRPAPFMNVIVEGCYDGDTCTVTIMGLPAVFGRHLPVRLAGIDAPEINGKCPRERELAIQARDLVRRRLRQAVQVDLLNPARDKYFRLLARIHADGHDLSAELLAQGLAVPYKGGHKESAWCAGGPRQNEIEGGLYA